MKNKTTSQNKSQQVRGSALREKIVESEKYGEDYRASHQGADAAKPTLPQDQKAQSSEHSSRKTK